MDAKKIQRQESQEMEAKNMDSVSNSNKTKVLIERKKEKTLKEDKIERQNKQNIEAEKEKLDLDSTQTRTRKAAKKILEQNLLIDDVPKPKIKKTKPSNEIAEESKSENTPKKERNKTEKQDKPNIES
jgi:hypothetical protein